MPVSITHDHGLPYQSTAWKTYAKEMGFESQARTPEDTEANRIAETFMSVLVKIIQAFIINKKDPQVEVRRLLMNYRNTPHSSHSSKRE